MRTSFSMYNPIRRFMHKVLTLSDSRSYLSSDFVHREFMEESFRYENTLISQNIRKMTE